MNLIICFKFGDGEFLRKEFDRKDKIDALFEFLNSLDKFEKGAELFLQSTHPNLLLSKKDKEKTLEELEIQNNLSFIVNTQKYDYQKKEGPKPVQQPNKNEKNKKRKEIPKKNNVPPVKNKNFVKNQVVSTNKKKIVYCFSK